ncbi:MAG: heavy-metal-associated domain-containing protein [Bacteroidota bacterium]|nr:heavy-metal-associated domain-containing protein [Bacteroidota bacterium]
MVSGVDGIENVEVDQEKKTTTVKFDKAKLEIASLEKTISDAGYDANDTPRNRETYDALPGCCKDGK